MVPTRSELRAFALALTLLGCRREAVPAPTPTPPPVTRAATSARALENHLPPTDLRVLARLEPSALVRDAETRRFLEHVFEPERVREFSALVGLAPEETERLWIASYPLGTLFLAAGRAPAERVEGRFLDRALTHTRKMRRSGFPVSTGTTSEGPAAFVQLSPTSFAWAEGDPSLAKIVLAFAEGRTKSLPSAAERKVLRHLLDFDRSAYAHVYFLGPFPEDAPPLVERTVGLAVSLRVKETSLECGMRLLGVFAPESDSLVEAAIAELARELATARVLREPPVLLGPVACTRAPELEPLESCSLVLSTSRADLEESLRAARAETLGELVRGLGAARKGSD